MRGPKLALWMIACAMVLSTCSVPVTASTDTFTVDARGTQATIGWKKIVLESGDYIVWNWTSTDWLDFQLFDPDGNELMNQEQSVGTSGTIAVSTTGTYSWRYANWYTTPISVTFVWGEIDEANVMDERLGDLEEELILMEGKYQDLNHSLSLVMEYLDDIGSGSDRLPWLEENLTMLQNEIGEMNSTVSDLNSQIIQLQEDLDKAKEDSSREFMNLSIILGVFIAIAYIAIVLLVVRGRGKEP